MTAGLTLRTVDQRVSVELDRLAASPQEVCEGIGGPVASLTVETPLEATGDAWPVLRHLWHLLGPGGMITVSYGRPGWGFRLDRHTVEGLLRLSGFEPVVPDGRAARGTLSASRRERESRAYTCSVIVPCRNEVDNVAPLVQRLPDIGLYTELIFVDGSSSDGTPEQITTVMAANPHRKIRLLHQTGGGGKAAAVFQGFDAAGGDVVMILDADMTVAPEDLERFYATLAEGVARFANGTRLVYPMDRAAMPALNLVGNQLFCRFLSWTLGTRISDSLCGTKAMFREDWQRIRAVRPLFGGHDPWGDFDLLLGAAYVGLQIIDVPIRYRSRQAGESKMHPFAHGMDLAKTCVAGVWRLKLSSRGPVAPPL